MTSIIALIVEFQLAHPSAGPDDCRAWLTSEEVVKQVDTMLAKFVKKPYVKKKGQQQQQQQSKPKE
jgi:hypothetical protein